MLRGDDNRIQPSRLVPGAVFHRDLRLSIGTKVRQRSILADFREALGESVREVNRGGHVILALVGGVAEHHALIAGAARVHTHSNITRLLVDARDYGAGVGVKSIERIVDRKSTRLNSSHT